MQNDILDEAIEYKNITVPMFDKIDALMCIHPADFDMMQYGELCQLYYKLLIEKAKVKNEALKLKESYKIDASKCTLNLMDGEVKMSIARIEEEVTVRLQEEKNKYISEEFRLNILDAKAQGISTYITVVRDSIRAGSTPEIVN